MTLCVTIARTRHKRTIEEHRKVAEAGATLAELRLDYIGGTVNLTRLLGDRPTPVVITCRRPEDGGRWQKTEEERQMLLRTAIASGVEYVDLEFDIASRIPRYGRTKRIISLHNFEETPDDLETIHRELAALDADIVKIACLVNSWNDVKRLIDLMQNADVPTIAIAMGDMGVVTRVFAPRWGAPFTYCVYSSERKVAPGQLTFDQMREIYRVETIDGDTEIFGVIADPVGHSYSPLIHNAAFAEQGINARYIPFRVPAEDLGRFLQWCPEAGVRGLSVTIPHKEAVVQYLSQAEQAVSLIGAVNTVVFDDQYQLVGYNTDYRAAMDSLTIGLRNQGRPTDNPFAGRSALLLGAGGVCRAIASGLRSRNVTTYISSRTAERADELAKAFNATSVSWDQRHNCGVDMLINGTPVGMFPEVDETPYSPDNWNSRMLVFDTVYNPEQTLLLKQARAVGCPAISGMEMFIRQAAYQYKLFTRQDAPVEVMINTLRRAISPINYRDLPQERDAQTEEIIASVEANSDAPAVSNLSESNDAELAAVRAADTKIESTNDDTGEANRT